MTDLRAIKVSKLLEIINDPKNEIYPDDLVSVNQVGNLHFVDCQLRDTRMWINLKTGKLEGEGIGDD